MTIEMKKELQNANNKRDKSFLEVIQSKIGDSKK